MQRYMRRHICGFYARFKVSRTRKKLGRCYGAKFRPLESSATASTFLTTLGRSAFTISKKPAKFLGELAPAQNSENRWSGKGSLLPCRAATPSFRRALLDRQGRPIAAFGLTARMLRLRSRKRTFVRCALFSARKGQWSEHCCRMIRLGKKRQSTTAAKGKESCPSRLQADRILGGPDRCR
jgi:hypothetical protein